MLVRAIRSLLILVLGLSVSGCAVMMAGQGHEAGSGRLSDAATQASPDSVTKFKIPPPDVGHTVPPTVAGSLVSEPTSEPGLTSVTEPGMAPTAAGAGGSPRESKHPSLASLVAGGGTLGGTDYDGFKTVGIALSGYPGPRIRLDLTGTFNGVDFKGEGLLGQALRNSIELSLDLTMRYYLTREHTFMGLYTQGGIGTGTLFWNYAKPVTVMENGAQKTISDDRLNYFSLFGGAGVSLLQTRYVHIGGNLIGGARFYGWHTSSGLENDILKTTGYLKALLEFSLRVGSR